MTNKKAAKTTKKDRPSKAKDRSKPIDTKPKNVGNEIIKLYLADPTQTNVGIAKKVGVTETTVRHWLKGRYKDKVDAAVKEFYGREIFALQGKAFKRLHKMLDDPTTPPHTIATICKFLLEKWLIDPSEETADVIEFETRISDNGTLEQIKRTVYDRRKELAEKNICIDTEITDVE